MGCTLQALIADEFGGCLALDGTQLSMQVGTTHTEVTGQCVNGIIGIDYMGRDSRNSFVEEFLISHGQHLLSAGWIEENMELYHLQEIEALLIKHISEKT